MPPYYSKKGPESNQGPEHICCDHNRSMHMYHLRHRLAYRIRELVYFFEVKCEGKMSHRSVATLNRKFSFSVLLYGLK